jgi:hypothetical protein
LAAKWCHNGTIESIMMPKWHQASSLLRGKQREEVARASNTDHRECFCLAYARFTRNTCQTALGENHFSEKRKTKRPEGRCYLI